MDRTMDQSIAEKKIEAIMVVDGGEQDYATVWALAGGLIVKEIVQ